MNSLIFSCLFWFPSKIYAPEQPAPCFASEFSSFPKNKTATGSKSLSGFLTYTFFATFTIKQIIHCYKYNQNKTFIPKILKKTFHWLNMTLNGSPSHVFWTLHVDFQTLHQSIPWMSTSNLKDMKMMVIMVEEKRGCLV